MCSQFCGAREAAQAREDPGQQAVISDYDEFVAEVGEFGLWQKMLCLILWFPAMAGGIHVLMYSFTGLAPYQYRLIQGYQQFLLFNRRL